MELVQHPLAKRYRLFSAEEMVRLRESVARLGVIEPVTRLDGMVLDGWHRLQISLELGVDCPTVEYDGREEDIVLWLAAKNEARRHLTDLQIAIMLANNTGSSKLTAVNFCESIISHAKPDKQLAAEHGIAPNMLSTARGVLASGDEDLIAEATTGDIGRNEARKRLRQLEAQRLADEQLASASPVRSDVVVCDVADLLSHVEPESAAAVITDPPWSDTQAWEDLARVSAEILKPGGTLAAMASKEDLPGVLDRLRAGAEGTDLKYRWLVGYALPKLGSRVHSVKFVGGWHPVIVMSRGRRTSPYCPDALEVDVLVAEWMHHARLRRHHRWEKDVPGFRTLIEWFSAPGELVVDPFLGSGTTGIAALQAGRQFFGSDLDPACVDTAGRRLNRLEAAA